jgi:hypothetical protein
VFFFVRKVAFPSSCLISLCVEWYFLAHRTKNTTDQRMDFVECNHPDVNHVNGERDTHHESMLVNYCNEQTGSPPPVAASADAYTCLY